jgi:tetratricopeptide (TPR) repeat protein
LNPAQLPTIERRGNAYGELGLWDQAAADFAKIAGPLAEDQNVIMGHNLLCIRAGDRAGYRAWCAKVLAQAAGAKDHDVANIAAWTCAMAPDTVDDFQPVVKLAERAVAGAPAATRLYYLNTLGAALCRNGQHQEALVQLRESIRLRGQGGVPIDWLIMAMAYLHLGQPDEARQWLDKAIPWVDEALQKPPLALGSPVAPSSRYEAKLLTWNERLEMQLLRKEAETLVTVKKERE